MGNKDLKITVYNHLDFEISSPFVNFSHWSEHKTNIIFTSDPEKYKFRTRLAKNTKDWELIDGCRKDSFGFARNNI